MTPIHGSHREPAPGDRVGPPSPEAGRALRAADVLARSPLTRALSATVQAYTEVADPEAHGLPAIAALADQLDHAEAQLIQ